MIYTNQYEPLEQRIWRRVNKRGPIHRTLKTPCWLWTGSIATNGYGSVQVHRRPLRVHRVVWEIKRGVIPKGINVLHKCDNPICVNPAHLCLGTHADNVVDRNLKGRQAKGEGVNTAKLSEEQVQSILRRHQSYCSINGTCALAAEFNVSRDTITLILQGKTWKHLKRKRSGSLRRTRA